MNGRLIASRDIVVVHLCTHGASTRQQGGPAATVHPVVADILLATSAPYVRHRAVAETGGRRVCQALDGDVTATFWSGGAVDRLMTVAGRQVTGTCDVL